jgi:hypothetical protein
MESFIGYIKTPEDALIIFEACRRGMLNRVQRRLTSKERMNIRSGSVFAWDEREAGMRRWTDGRTWSPSRVLGSFLTYRELDTKRRPRRPTSSPSNSLPGVKQVAFSYKHDGLVKQSFSICTASNQKIHLISYYSKADVIAGRLQRPSHDPVLNQIVIPKGFYPELNPLDMGGGHTASFHTIYHDRHAYNSDEEESSPPPSLTSASPQSSDEDYGGELLPALELASTQMKQIPSTNIMVQSPLPIQDIAWGKLPLSEDKRQLNALRDQLRI